MFICMFAVGSIFGATVPDRVSTGSDALLLTVLSPVFDPTSVAGSFERGTTVPEGVSTTRITLVYRNVRRRSKWSGR